MRGCYEIFWVFHLPFSRFYEKGFVLNLWFFKESRLRKVILKKFMDFFFLPANEFWLSSCLTFKREKILSFKEIQHNMTFFQLSLYTRMLQAKNYSLWLAAKNTKWANCVIVSRPNEDTIVSAYCLHMPCLFLGMGI